MDLIEGSGKAGAACVADGISCNANSSSRRQRALCARESLAGGEGNFAVGTDFEAARGWRIAARPSEQVKEAAVVHEPLEHGGISAVPTLQVQEVRGRRRTGNRAYRRQTQRAVQRFVSCD